MLQEKAKLFMQGVLVALLVVVVVLASVIFWYDRKFGLFAVKDMYIDGIQPNTIYNRVGESSVYVNDVVASVASVLRFYEGSVAEDRVRILRQAFVNIDENNKTRDLRLIQREIEGLGYRTRIVLLHSVRDIEPFLREEIPVLIPHKLSIFQPQIGVYSFGVITGLKSRGDTVILDDYYWGYDKEVPFDTLLELSTQENGSASFMVILPKDDSRDRVDRSPFQRTALMDQADPYINSAILISQALQIGFLDTANILSRTLVEDPNFEKLTPPLYQVLVYSTSGLNYLIEFKNYEKADELIKKAEALNQKLDAPFSDFWPGFVDTLSGEIGVSEAPYYARGMYQMIKDKAYADAIESFNKALKIWPQAKHIQQARSEAEGFLTE